MDKEAKVYVTGHTGLVGSAIVRRLKQEGYKNIITRSHKELDLTRQEQVEGFFQTEKPDYVYAAAAMVGGIYANNTKPAEFMYNNMAITLHVIHAAWQSGVKKLLYMGSNCAYPCNAKQPVNEACLLQGAVEKTNEAYALAKIAGVKMCEYYNRQYGTDFISCMPCNAYGPGDNYDPENSHVIPALIRKFYEAKQEKRPEVVMWGSGRSIREFIYIDDIASAALFLMDHYSGNETVNIGTGLEYSIGELAEVIRKVVGYEGRVINDLSKPDGIPRKLVDSGRLFEMGWRPEVAFEKGIREALADYITSLPAKLNNMDGRNDNCN